MDIEYETSDAAIRVGYLVQCIGRTVRYKGLSRCPVISGKENELRGRTVKPMMNTAGSVERRQFGLPRFADSGHRSLYALRPANDVWDIVRLVHTGLPKPMSVRLLYWRKHGLHAEDDFVVGSILGRDRSPGRCEFIICRATLANDLTC